MDTINKWDTGRQERVRFPRFLVLLGTGLVLLLAACTEFGRSRSDFPYFIDDLLESLEVAVGVMRLVFALSGLALMLAGWKIYRFVVALPGVVIGSAIGLMLGYAGNENWLIGMIGLVLGGLVGAGLALALHDLVVFIIGAVIGALLIGGLYGWIADGFPPALVLIIGSVGGGALLLMLSRMWMVALTSAIGALLFGIGVGAPFGLIPLFFVLGIAVQYGLANALGEKLAMPGALRKWGGQAEATPSLASPADPRPAPLPGARPVALSPPDPQPIALPPPPSAVLVNSQGEIYRAGDGFRIGRGSACDLRLRDRSVSRNHAVVRFANDRWYVQDQGSLHGTFVNGQRTEAAELRPGDRISIGDSEFEFKPV